MHCCISLPSSRGTRRIMPVCRWTCRCCSPSLANNLTKRHEKEVKNGKSVRFFDKNAYLCSNLSITLMRKSKYIIILTFFVAVIAFTAGCTKPDRSEEATRLLPQFILPHLQRSLWHVTVGLQKGREKIKNPHSIGKKGVWPSHSRHLFHVLRLPEKHIFSK